MKKIIKGRVYDTTTAQELAHFSNRLGWRDSAHVEETLYKKRTGEYFLYGIGGPASRYARQVAQNEWTGCEAIRPMSFEAARRWAEENLDGDEYESIFGKVVDDDYRLNAVLPASLKAAMDERQNVTGESLTDMVRIALEAYLNRPETYEEKPETSASGMSYRYFIRNGSGDIAWTETVSRADRAQFVENLKAQGLTEHLSTTSQHFYDLADIGPKQDGLSDMARYCRGVSMRYRQGQAVQIIGPPESPYIGKIGNIQGKRSYQMGIEGYEVWVDGTLETFSASYLVPFLLL